MSDRPQFSVPELPNGLFEARTVPIVPTAAIDTAMDKATPQWPGITRGEVELALSTDWAGEDPLKAVDLLQYYFDAASGNVVSIGGERRVYSGPSMLHHTLNLFSLSRPTSKSFKLHEMRGAANYGGVSCYISSTLSAMFSRLENFEPLLHQKFDDPDVNLLATWLRIFVNMLRSGDLISKDILKAFLACCYNLGWTQCGQGGPNHQQDAGEFFTFLTDILHMPLLSLRVDIAHAGREVAEDDHKLVTEQLLFLPIPDGEGPILLEECLELYFSDIISVSRPCNRADKIPDRRPTFSSTSSHTNNTGEPSSTPRRRAYSIISQTTQPHSRRADFDDLLPSDSPTTIHRRRRSSVPDTLLPTYTQLFGDTKEVIDKKNQLWTNNNEITFPAWMFYQLMPFYARNQDSEKLKNLEAQQVASHFEKTRPVLAMCLKRFGMDDNGNQVLKTRKVIIPHTINLPSFVADDTDMDHAFGNFKLVLESVVFHKGPTNHSGHYTSLVREEYFTNHSSSSLATSAPSQKGLWRRRSKREHRSHHSSSCVEDEIPERWLLFDDQAPDSEKVQVVSFTTALENNMPYLLFYRMVALDEDSYENSRRGSSHPDLSPVLSPSISGPVSPRLIPVDGQAQTFQLHAPVTVVQGGGELGPSSAQSSTSQKSHVPHFLGPNGPSGPSGPGEEKKKKGKSIFSRKHRDKEYARAYREEKCKVM